MNDEDKARLSIVLTSILNATKAKNALAKAAMAFSESVKNASPLDADAVLALLDEAVKELAAATEEAKVFRTIVRDERSPAIKNMARAQARDPWRYRDTWGRDLPRHQHDPQAVIDRMLNRKPPKGR